MVSAHKKIVRREVRETCNLLMYWLEIFPHSVDLTQSVIYIFWNEFDYFISAMAKVLGTSYTVVAVTTLVQILCYCRRGHQKYCLVIRGQILRNWIVSNCLFGFTRQPLHIAFAKRSQKTLNCARVQGQNLSRSPFTECHSSCHLTSVFCQEADEFQRLVIFLTVSPSKLTGQLRLTSYLEWPIAMLITLRQRCTVRAPMGLSPLCT